MTGHAGPQTDPRLDRLATVAVRVGLNLQPGQELVLTAPIEALPLARAITREAYAAGASLVTTLLGDDQATLARFAHAPDAAFDTAAGWLYAGMAEAYRNGAARLAISGDDPTLLTGQDPEKVARANRARSKAYVPALELIANFATNWTIVSAATPAWARTVFPDLPEDRAVARLWDAVFAASRVDGPDPLGAWARHNADLHARKDRLNAERFAALRFQGPAPTSRWGSPTTTNGAGARRPRAAASPATPTSRPRRSSPRRTGCGWTGTSPAPSRSPTRAR